MGFCMNLWKSLLVIINTIFLILGCGVAGFGIWVLTSTSNVREAFFPLTDIVGFILRAVIVIGSIIGVLSFLGFWGVISEKKWMLKIYVVVLILIIIVQVGIAITIPRFLEANDIFKMRAQGVMNSQTEGVDVTQGLMECCGYYGPEEMQNIAGVYPASCCRKVDYTGICILPYETGCRSRFISLIIKYGGFYAGFVGFEIVCAIAAIFVITSITRKLRGSAPYIKMN